jgi:hypothetical protein
MLDIVVEKNGFTEYLDEKLRGELFDMTDFRSWFFWLDGHQLSFWAIERHTGDEASKLHRICHAVTSQIDQRQKRLEADQGKMQERASGRAGQVEFSGIT